MASAAPADRDALGSFHPAIALAFFAAVIGITMFSMHPAILATSLTGGVLYRIRLDGWRRSAGLAGLVASAFVLPAIINPLFNHGGVTVLWYFPSGNPLTLESIVYGAAMGVMLAGTLAWCGCMQRVMTSDKVIYLFGRVWPALALVFSMTLRFVPRFRAQLGRISAAQRGIGRGSEASGVRERLHDAMRSISILATWSLESSVDTADSMRSRAYGLRGRTSFSIFRFEARDGVLAVVLAVVLAPVAVGIATGGLAFHYLPCLTAPVPSASGFLGLVAFGLLCLTPVVLDCLEDLRWRYLRSRI